MSVNRHSLSVVRDCDCLLALSVGTRQTRSLIVAQRDSRTEPTVLLSRRDWGFTLTQYLGPRETRGTSAYREQFLEKARGQCCACLLITALSLYVSTASAD